MKSKNKTEDMVDIIQHIQQYTPVSSSGKVAPIFFGDQLPRERAYLAQSYAKAQSGTVLGRFQGVIPKVEDWHTLVTFYQV